LWKTAKNKNENKNLAILDKEAFHVKANLGQNNSENKQSMCF
jgi:hypothetical protein